MSFVTFLGSPPVPLAAADPYADYLVYDTFTDSNGTTLAAHVPEKAPLGSSWAAYPSAYTIQGNMAATPSAADRQYQAIDAGAADVVVECDVVFPSPAKSIGLVGRLQDATHCWFYIIHSALVARIYTDNAGFTQVAQSTGFTAVAGQTYRFRVETSANNHDFYIDETLMCSVVGNAFLASETEFGFWVNGGTAAERWDNFTVVSN